MTGIHYKRTELTKQLGLLLIAAALVLMIIDWGYGLLSFSYPYYLVLCAFGGLCYYLCTINQQILAATTGQLVTYLVIFAFATDTNIMDGILLFYIPAVLATFVLFDSKRFVLRIVFCGLAVVLFFTARYVDWNVFSHGPESALNYPASFIIYFFSTLLLSILLLQILVKTNTKVENRLLDKQNELRRLSLRLKKNQTRLVLANKGSKIGVYEWNLTTNKVYVSDEWQVLLGYVNQGSSLNSSDSFLARIHVEDRQTIIAAIERYQHLEEPYELEIRRETGTGECIWCLDRGMVTTQHDGSHLIVGTTMNINERKKNELVIQEQMRKLQDANRELDAFVYTASHDLRSPLNSILQLMSTASSSTSLEEVKTYLAYMKNSIKVLNEFILSLSEYAQGTNKELAIERIEILYLVKDILDSLRYNSWYQNVETTIDIPHNIVIYTDRSRLRIVLNNLIINAIKYQDQQKETQFVKIAAEQRGDNIHLLIVDNGIGIESDYLERIFDMFYRAQNSIEGSGLGLYITSEIIAQMKGRLFFCSSLEEGSAFKMILPCVISTSFAGVEPALEIVG